MKTPLFIGRELELQELKRHTRKRIASLIVIKGRRRIGKSRLVEQFGQGYQFLEFAGIAPNEKTTKQSQLDEFASQLGHAISLTGIKADDWNTLFLLLAKHTQKKQVVILLDEISWMGSKDPDFLGKLKNAWDLHFKKNPKLILFICSSVSSWIEKNILSSTAFFGRVSYTLTLEELPLEDCNQFWQRTGCHFSAYDKFKILSITGGVPRYLEEIQTHMSAEENIKNLCFKKGGLLTHEFEKIFSDLFGSRAEKYKNIISCLVNGSLDYAEICEKLKIGKSGLISEYLNDLTLSGFISRDHTWNLKTGLAAPLQFKYRLRDNYLRFYLKYIANKLPDIERNAYHTKSVTGLAGWSGIMGLQFENLVLNNRVLIQQALNLVPEDIVTDNPYFQRRKSRQAGCQVDYLIQTRTKVLYVCEIKFSRDVLKKEVIREVQDKIKKLIMPRGMSVCPVLIHVNGVNDAVIDSDYFTEIIDFGKSLGYEGK
jgi:AAA+ ATPase superfamily predicted ATPase